MMVRLTQNTSLINAMVTVTRTRVIDTIIVVTGTVTTIKEPVGSEIGSLRLMARALTLVE